LNSDILRTILRVVQPVFLLLAAFLFIRGHNNTGGGFVAGLVAAVAPALEALVAGTESARRSIRVRPESLAGAGVLVLVTSGILPLLAGKPFLTGVWSRLELGFGGYLELGSPLLFDAGVLLTVFGIVLTIAFSLMEAP
jgi:multisubunit Na+/H+ antiporter MnhB subunit